MIRSKKGTEASPVWLTGAGLILALLLIGAFSLFILGCQKNMASTESQIKSPSESINSIQNIFQMNEFESITDFNIPEGVLTKNVYRLTRTKNITTNLKNGEMLLFFSSGGKDISFNYINKNNVQTDLTFHRPANSACSQGACVCYYRGFDLVDTKTGQLNIDNNIRLPPLSCLPLGDVKFVSGQGNYSDEDIEFFKKINNQKRVPIPLEIYMVAKRYSDIGIPNNYVSGPNFINSPQDDKIINFALKNMNWSGGYVVGGFGYAAGGKLISNYQSGPIDLYFTKFPLESEDVYSIGINTHYSISQPLYEELYMKNIFEESVKDLSVFEATATMPSEFQKFLIEQKSLIIQDEFEFRTNFLEPFMNALSKTTHTKYHPRIKITSLRPQEDSLINSKITFFLSQKQQKEIYSDIKFNTSNIEDNFFEFANIDYKSGERTPTGPSTNSEIFLISYKSSDQSKANYTISYKNDEFVVYEATYFDSDNNKITVNPQCVNINLTTKDDCKIVMGGVMDLFEHFDSNLPKYQIEIFILFFGSNYKWQTLSFKYNSPDFKPEDIIDYKISEEYDCYVPYIYDCYNPFYAGEKS